jgi:hypothetical protein
MKNTLLLFCLVCLTKQLPAQNSADQTWVIISYIKESAKTDYEKWMTDIFFAHMQSSQDPVLKKQFSTARWQKPVRQNADKTWTYGILLDPAIPNADYGIESFLVKTYGEAKGKNYAKQYEDFMASSGQMHFFETSKGLTTPSVKSEEEAIKKVIIDESTSWAKRDTTAYFDAFAQNEITQGAWNNRNLSYGVYSGFETLQKSVRDNIKSNPTPSYGTNMERTNWLIKLLSPEWAWVNYTQKTTTVRGIVNTSYETRLMHKEDGKWRINVVNALWDYKNVVYPTPNPEEEDIKKVIINETEMFLEQKKDAWAENFIHEPYLTWTVTNGGEPGDVLTMRGWDALNTYMNVWFGNDMSAMVKEWRKAKTTHDQWNIQIRSNVAYVSYNQHMDNAEKQTKMDSTETRVLEKINGKWKIVMLTALADFKDATPPIKSKY